MITHPLKFLLNGLTDISTEIEIGHLSLDSRNVQSDSLFLASGQAIKHLPEAIAQLPRAIVVDEAILDLPQTRMPIFRLPNLRAQVSEIAGRFYGHPSRQLTLIGVTGTNGKTSVTHYVAQAFAAIGKRTAVIGTIGNGPVDALTRASLTTPDPIALQALLADYVSAGITHVAMEVSSHALDQQRVAALQFDQGIFTNLTQDHLDYHHDMARYFSAKAQLFEWPALTARIFNTDDPAGKSLWERYATQPGTIAYGLSEGTTALKNVLTISELQLSASGLMGRLCRVGAGTDHDHGFSSLLLGRFNAENLLAVAASLAASGVTMAEIATILPRLKPVPGRLERLGGTNGLPLVVVDYAHTPAALQAALSTLRALSPEKLTVVFGCGGNRDRDKRSKMGAVAAMHADQIILTDDNPRDEDPLAIIADIMRGISDNVVSEVIPDRATAILSALKQSDENAIVLIAGKGHEDYQERSGKRYPFSDRAVVESYFSKRQD